MFKKQNLEQIQKGVVRPAGNGVREISALELPTRRLLSTQKQSALHEGFGARRVVP